MDRFEEIGRRIDEEVTKLKRYLDDKVVPETERRTAVFLRDVSNKLSDAASKLEARVTARRSPPPENPPQS